MTPSERTEATETIVNDALQGTEMTQSVSEFRDMLLARYPTMTIADAEAITLEAAKTVVKYLLG